ncbi:B3/4 domain-containing protein [Streptomyces sp. NPDC049879]|uniref:B3/4 domain-containing protein n=1 Tax=Streptomyces sp. NPDC049879 TaxID=3365598 RepID=UPI003797EED7
MTTIHIDEAVAKQFPDVSVAAVTARGVDGTGTWADAEAALAGLEADAASGAWTAPGETDPRIAAWHAVYRDFGTNPRRTRPSVDALCRRLGRNGRLPRVNAPVDAYNSVSVRHVLPAGAFDLDEVHGDIHLRPARDGDVFTPLGEPEATEQPGPGEVVYADTTSVLTRHWNHRDADRTKVTADSRAIVFLLESAQGDGGRALLAEAAASLTALLTPHAAQVSWELLGRSDD